jgi:hypothetical protein
MNSQTPDGVWGWLTFFASENILGYAARHASKSSALESLKQVMRVIWVILNMISFLIRRLGNESVNGM